MIDAVRRPAAMTSGAEKQTVLLTGARRGNRVEVERADGHHLYIDRKQLAFPKPARVAARINSKANPQVRDEYFTWSGPLRSTYPRLRVSELEAVDSPDSNCIANTLHRDDKTIWPGHRLRDFDALYRKHGFMPCTDVDLRHCPGFEKVALLGLQPTSKRYEPARLRLEKKGRRLDDGPICLHAVLQERSGTWTSKEGALPRIRIANPHKLEGGHYGDIVRVYIRAV